MVPVTQKPPKSAAPMFATPCATSSMFDRCCVPDMPSATIADKSDSIAPSRVKLKAQGSAARTASSEISGRAGAGRSRGRPPKRDWIVSTGSCSSVAASVIVAMPRSRLGRRGAKRLSASISATVESATPTAVGLIVSRAAQSAESFSRIGPGSPPASVSPAISLIWLAKMITPMPEVKPTVTG